MNRSNKIILISIPIAFAFITRFYPPIGDVIMIKIGNMGITGIENIEIPLLNWISTSVGFGLIMYIACKIFLIEMKSIRKNVETKK